MNVGEAAVSERERLMKLYREQIGQYKSVNAELADLEWTLADVERQIAELRPHADSADPMQVRRVDDLERWKNALEEGILQRLYRAEALAAAVADLRDALRDPIPEA